MKITIEIDTKIDSMQAEDVYRIMYSLANSSKLEKKVGSTEIKEEFKLPASLEEDHIDALDLTMRSRNCLKSENIFKITELIKYSRKDMLKTPNLGQRSLQEIVDVLDYHGLKLREEND